MCHALFWGKAMNKTDENSTLMAPRDLAFWWEQTEIDKSINKIYRVWQVLINTVEKNQERRRVVCVCVCVLWGRGLMVGADSLNRVARKHLRAEGT